MDSKYRILKALNFEKADRTGIYDSFWKKFSAKCIAELGLAGDTVLEDYFDMDIFIAAPDESPFPSKNRVIAEKDGYYIMQDGWGGIIRKSKIDSFFEELEPFIKDGMDISGIEFESACSDNRFVEWEDKVRREKSKGKCVFGKIGGPFLRTMKLRGQMQYLMDIASEPEYVGALVDKYTSFLLKLGIESLRRGGLYDTGIWIFDDMGHNRSTLISPESFERIYYPAYKKLVRGLKKAGAAIVGLHSDGNIIPVLDMLVDAGIDVLNPVEPKAGMSIAELKKKYGRKLAYVGGMCNAVVLPGGPVSKIIASTLEIIEQARDGGVVIGTHSIGPDVPVAHYLAYHETVMNTRL